MKRVLEIQHSNRSWLRALRRSSFLFVIFSLTGAWGQTFSHRVVDFPDAAETGVDRKMAFVHSTVSGSASKHSGALCRNGIDKRSGCYKQKEKESQVSPHMP